MPVALHSATIGHAPSLLLGREETAGPHISLSRGGFLPRRRATNAKGRADPGRIERRFQALTIGARLREVTSGMVPVISSTTMKERTPDVAYDPNITNMKPYSFLGHQGSFKSQPLCTFLTLRDIR